MNIFMVRGGFEGIRALILPPLGLGLRPILIWLTIEAQLIERRKLAHTRRYAFMDYLMTERLIEVQPTFRRTIRSSTKGASVDMAWRAGPEYHRHENIGSTKRARLAMKCTGSNHAALTDSKFLVARFTKALCANRMKVSPMGGNADDRTVWS